jgi:hypothetical protein
MYPASWSSAIVGYVVVGGFWISDEGLVAFNSGDWRRDEGLVAFAAKGRLYCPPPPPAFFELPPPPPFGLGVGVGVSPPPCFGLEADAGAALACLGDPAAGDWPP